MSAPLYGLVLTGGRSQRMQRDKATLEYAGQSQLARAMTLLAPLTARQFISVRGDEQDAERARHARIADRIAGQGPISGIHAALHAEPHAAWLVLACDLPFLDSATLQGLIAARAPQQLATAYASRFDGKPEPLCAIWEPHSRSAVDAWIAAGKNCPRSFLTQHEVALLPLHGSRALDNINTAQEYLGARGALATLPSGSTRESDGAAKGDGRTLDLRVRYFAVLRDAAGRSEEQLQSAARTPRELYAELQSRHAFKLLPEQLRVAVNDQFADWNRALASGDAVVFLPPVAGG